MESSNFFVVGIPSQKCGNELRRVSLEEHIKYTLRAAILTQVGERKLSPQVGSEIREMLFKPLLSSAKVELQNLIQTAIYKNEPRIEIENLDVEGDSMDRSRLLISLGYRIKETSKRDQIRLRIQ